MAESFPLSKPTWDNVRKVYVYALEEGNYMCFDSIPTDDDLAYEIFHHNLNRKNKEVTNG